jgi:malonyl CoA-acyl carrier protein transacylase
MNKIGLLFVGQGAQTVGMGRDVASQFLSRRLFQQADEILAEVERDCMERPIEELTRLELSAGAFRSRTRLSGCLTGTDGQFPGRRSGRFVVRRNDGACSGGHI